MKVSKQVDLLLRDPAGRTLTVEVAGNAEHEVHNALHCVRCDEVVKHIVVCLNKKILEIVNAKFHDCEELKDEERVEVILLSKALSEKWMPL